MTINTMKFIRFITFLLMFFYWNTGYTKNMTIYDFSFEDIDGNSVDLSKFEGKPIFMVNTASRCGFTPQYENLQNLFMNYKDTDLTILAITSNSFNQEYSSTEDIKKICLVNYDVGFVTSSPLSVKGDDAHEIFSWLSKEYGKTPKWNFYKYLFNRKGMLHSSWSSMTKPDSSNIIKDINKML
jgi:glutathione peroxidase